MEENETVQTDYAALVKEAAIKGAVTAAASIAVTYVAAALTNKVKSRRNKTADPVAKTNE